MSDVHDQGGIMNDDPYHDGGTRGSSGSGASRDAARADLVHGVTSAAQKYVLVMATQARERGITSAELREAKGSLHHGRVSSAITKQHIAGRLVRLRERRGNCHVYVLPEFVTDRAVMPYRQQNVKLQVEDVEDVLKRHRLGLSGYCSCGMSLSLEPAMHRAHVAGLIVALSRGEQ